MYFVHSKPRNDLPFVVTKHPNQIPYLPQGGLLGTSGSHINNTWQKLCVFSRREDVLRRRVGTHYFVGNDTQHRLSNYKCTLNK